MKRTAAWLSSFAWIVLLMFAPFARAQDVQILYPQNGQLVRGEITVRYTGIPDGGYAIVKIDGNFSSATAQTSFPLNTFPPNFTGDGTHRLSITGINSSGKSVGSAEVSFDIANGRKSTGEGSVLFTHYINAMRNAPEVQRYRIFAVSDAYTESAGVGGGGGGAGAGAGGEGEGDEWIPAPLDWQISAFLRREVRDVGLFSDDKKDGVTSANIKTVVQEAFHRQRKSEGSNGAAGGPTSGASSGPKRRKKKKGPPTKAPWKDEWTEAPEYGQYFVKTIEPSGKEINATRKDPTIAMADLLPTFPTTPISPGSTWETRMTFLGELSTREPVKVTAPITFTSFETIKTLAGFNTRTAKLESRFVISPALDRIQKTIAINLILQGGASTSGGGGGATGAGAGGNLGAGSAAGTTASSLAPEDFQAYSESITGIRTSLARIIWFDDKNHRVIRSQDVLRISFAYEPVEEDEGGGGGGGGLGGAAGGAGAGPTKISYVHTVDTWLDDTVPAVSPSYNGGGGAHSTFGGNRDPYTAKDPNIDKINKPTQP